MLRFYTFCFLFGILIIHVCQADDSEEKDGKSFDDTVGESMKGIGNWFKDAAEEVKEKSETGVETMKGLSEQAKEKSQSGFDAVKGFAEGIGDRFSNVKEKLAESGDKIKDAFGNAAERSKDEFENAGSKVSKHVKEASETMFGLFGK